MNGPRPTKSSLFRASHKGACSQPDESKGTPGSPELLPRRPLLGLMSCLRRWLRKGGRRWLDNRTSRNLPRDSCSSIQAIGQTGIAGSRRVAGHSGSSGSKSLSSTPSSTVAASSISPPSSSFGKGSRSSRRLQQEVGASRVYRNPAQVRSLKSCLKANSTDARSKQVHWGVDDHG
jgi:hypothetical protein